MASEEEAGFVVVAELNSTYTGCSQQRTPGQDRCPEPAEPGVLPRVWCGLCMKDASLMAVSASNGASLIVESYVYCVCHHLEGQGPWSKQQKKSQVNVS